MELLTWSQGCDNICLNSSTESRSLLVPKGMEKTAANSEDASASLFLLSPSQQREHTECGGNLFVM